LNIKIAAVATVVGIMALCLLATKPLAGQPGEPMSNTGTACSLTMPRADPGSGSLATGESMGQTISGKLTCGGTGLGGATINLHITPGTDCCPYKFNYGQGVTTSTKTDSSGNYDKGIVVQAGQFVEVVAYYNGDTDHKGAVPTATHIDIKQKNTGRFTQP
jgi:hypothetical protein